jgi:hypothetical protein
MVNEEILKKYPVIYAGEFATVHDMSEDYPGLAYGFWCGFFRLNNPKFIQEMNDSISLIKEYNIKIYLSDHSLLKVVSKEVIEWLHDNWYSGALQNGLQFEIALDAESVIANMSLKRMLDNNNTNGVVTVSVPTIEEGIELSKEYLALS